MFFWPPDLSSPGIPQSNQGLNPCPEQWKQSKESQPLDRQEILCLRLFLKHPCPGFPYSAPFSSALHVFRASSSLDSKVGKPTNPFCTLGLRLKGEKVGKVKVSVEGSEAKAEGKTEMSLRRSAYLGTLERAKAKSQVCVAAKEVDPALTEGLRSCHLWDNW